MDAQQNSTNTQNVPTVVPQTVELINGITPVQDDYVALVAVGGLVPDPDGEKTAIKVTASQFAARYGIDRTTLYNWRKSIPNFWERVADKRQELYGRDRITQVWNGVFLKAATGNPQAAALYLANHDKNFRMPTEKHEVEMGSGFADLVNAKRKLMIQQAKVIDVEPDSHTPAA